MTREIERPWLRFYPPGVPHHVEHAPRLLGELVPEAARRWPDRPATILAVAAAGRVFTSRLSWAGLSREVDAFAASLQRLGVRKGDRVALYLPNCPQLVIGFFAAQRVGAIAVPFNPLYSAREAEHQLADCGAQVALVGSPFFALVKKVQPRTALRHVIVTRLKERFPAPLWLLYTLTKERREPQVRLGEGDRWFTSLLGPGVPEPVAGSEEDTAVLLYTGGTTGVSKGVELSHRNLIFNAEQNRAWASIGEGCETTLAALPLFHAFGLTCCLNLGALTGATLALVPNPRDIGGLLRIAHRLRPTIFPVVPTLLVAIEGHPEVDRFDLRSIRVAPCAGSPLPLAVQRAFVERTGVRPVEGYGLTEAGPTTHGNPPAGDDRRGTVGLPYPDTDARVMDLADRSREAGFDEGCDWSRPGELQVRGPQVMKGYWNRPEATAEQLRDGWLSTGDVAQVHRDGYFRVVDRLKDVIIRGGFNVYPAEVEAVLHEHPKVAEALVIGVPEALHGEVVKAFVVPRAGAALAPEEVLAHCRENLARYKVPAQVEIRADLPRSAVGKPLRRMLREERARSSEEVAA